MDCFSQKESNERYELMGKGERSKVSSQEEVKHLVSPKEVNLFL